MAASAPGKPYRRESGSVLLTLRLTPKGGRDAIDGVSQLSDGRFVLLARVRAVPEDGAANGALIALLATSLRLPASAFALAQGATSRLKTIRITGAYEEVVERLENTLKASIKPASQQKHVAE